MFPFVFYKILNTVRFKKTKLRNYAPKTFGEALLIVLEAKGAKLFTFLL